MKIAISGKGGVGKTTFSALLARTYNDEGKKVLAIDADPDANLSSALGIKNSEKNVPISEMKELIFQRTEAKPGTIGGFFKLNPKVDDLPDELSIKFENIKLMRLGSVKKGGAGCICPESTLLKALVTHIVLEREEIVILDMEAGIEHLGRATAQAVDKLIIVVEPGRRSIDTAMHIKKLATEINLSNIAIVGNKIRNKNDEEFIIKHLKDFHILGFIPYNNSFVEADINGKSPFNASTNANIEIKKIILNISKG